jgi:hypothetical protein
MRWLIWVALNALEKQIARAWKSPDGFWISRLVLGGLIEISAFAFMVVWRLNGGNRWWRDVPWQVPYPLGQILVLAFPVALAFFVNWVVLPRSVCAQYESRWLSRSPSSRRVWSRVMLALWFAWGMSIAATFAVGGRYQVQV